MIDDFDYCGYFTALLSEQFIQKDGFMCYSIGKIIDYYSETQLIDLFGGSFFPIFTNILL